MNDNISILEQLTIAVEQSGANLAPTYQEYMPLAFAVANSCGEEGRSLFHRICRMSEKYNREEADKLYGYSLQKGTGKNSLGTVFHLSELAGVRLGQKLANLQNLPSPHTHTRACAQGDTAGTAPAGSTGGKAFDANMDDGADLPPVHLPFFADYRWPAFLQQIIDCGDSPAQRDILLLGTVTVLGSTINRLISLMYGRKNKYPCLQTFVIALPASGKGALTWMRRLAEPIHEALLDDYQAKLKEYHQAKVQWDTLGKQKASTPEPEQPCMKMHLIAGDNTGTGILENLIDSGGVGLICETEADTVSSAIGSDYGHWSDTLRKAFDHERLAFNRRTNHEYRECNKSYLSVLLSGTPAQVRPLIPSAENGLFSRQLFYYMPAIKGWEDQFCCSDTDYDSLFSAWGTRWKTVLDAMTATVSGISLKLDDGQKEEFNIHLARVFERAGAVHGDAMRSSVTRIAVNICRIMSVVALLRSLESLLPGGVAEGKPLGYMVRTLMSCPGLAPSPHTPKENITDGAISQFDLTIRADDFHAVLSLVEPLYCHACYVLSLLPSIPLAAQLTEMAPETLFDRLPLRFTRNEALREAERCSMPAGSLDSLLKRMVQRGRLLKTGRGEYEFASRMHTGVCGCEDSASSASLQDSFENKSV